MATSVTLVILLGLYFSTSVDAAVEPDNSLVPLEAVDLRSFSDRAAAWRVAHSELRDQTRIKAMALAAQARAQQNSSNQSASEAASSAVVSTTSQPTSTTPPTTATSTTAPPATVPPTTVLANIRPAVRVGASTVSYPLHYPQIGPDGIINTPTEQQWEALRHCEATGNYKALSPGGRYRGAYQFNRTTWNWVAPKIGAHHLVGVDPAQASPEDQDRMALALWNINGWKPWPACSKKLGYR